MGKIEPVGIEVNIFSIKEQYNIGRGRFSAISLAERIRNILEHFYHSQILTGMLPVIDFYARASVKPSADGDEEIITMDGHEVFSLSDDDERNFSLRMFRMNYHKFLDDVVNAVKGRGDSISIFLHMDIGGYRDYVDLSREESKKEP